MTPQTLVFAGPTSAGKSGVALQIAQEFDAVIVSADAMQVYRHMDIGTGKVTAAEQSLVPHLGINIRDPNQRFDAADFVSLADRALTEHARVIVVGGTSLYLRSFVRGLVKTPPVDPALRTRLQALDNAHEALKLVDPVLADRLHPNDRIRVIRGLEVFEQMGQRLSDLQQQHALAPDRVAVAGLWLDRDDLNQRIDARVHQMIGDGYVQEVERLLALGFDRTLKPMQSLGYRHLADHVIDGLPLDQAIERTQRATRQFARKQRNWAKQLPFDRVQAADALDRGRALATTVFGGS